MVCKLSDEKHEELSSRLMEGSSTHASLAKVYGVSRERIRQIAVSLGAPSGRDRQREERRAREEVKAEQVRSREEVRENVRLEKYKRWQELWDAGKTMKEMAAETGYSYGSLTVAIVGLRKRYGWFPYRKTQWHMKKAKLNTDPVVREIVELWRLDKSIKDIAAELNMTPAKLNGIIASIRTYNPSLFPRRR